MALYTAMCKHDTFSAAFVEKPTQMGQLRILKDGSNIRISSLSQAEFLELCSYLYDLAQKLQEATSVLRVGLASDHQAVYLLPMHGLKEGWQPMRGTSHRANSFSTIYRGYLDTCSGPRQPSEDLEAVQKRVTRLSALPATYNTSFSGDSDNLFARIVRGEEEQWRIFESADYVAVLTPFPHTPGGTVILPREHLSSNIFSIPKDSFMRYVEASYTVMQLLREALEVQEVAIFFEGYEIDMAHIKLYTIPVAVEVDEQEEDQQFHNAYPGYLTTREGPAMSQEVERQTMLIRERLARF